MQFDGNLKSSENPSKTWNRKKAEKPRVNQMILTALFGNCIPQWLQHDQTLPLSAKGLACETSWKTHPK